MIKLDWLNELINKSIRDYTMIDLLKWCGIVLLLSVLFIGILSLVIGVFELIIDKKRKKK